MGYVNNKSLLVQIICITTILKALPKLIVPLIIFQRRLNNTHPWSKPQDPWYKRLTP